MLRFFQNNNILMFVFFPVIAGLFSLAVPKDFVSSVNIENQTLIYKQILSIIRGTGFEPLYKILFALFLTLNGVIFNKFVISIKLCKTNNFFVGFVFTILLGVSSLVVDVLPSLIALSLFLPALGIASKTLRKQFAIFDFLNSGMMVSLSALFWEGVIVLTPILFICLFVLRSGQWREWLSALIGLFIPWGLLLAVYFLIFSNVDFLIRYYNAFTEQKTIPQHTTGLVILAGYVTFLSFVSTLQMIRKFRTFESDNQDFYKVFFLLFLITVGAVLLNPGILYNMLPFSFIALVIPFGRLFAEIRKRFFAELLFSIFILLIIAASIKFSF